MIAEKAFALSHLDLLQRRELFRRLNRPVPDVGTELNPCECVPIFVAGLLHKLRFLSAEQRWLALDALLPALTEFNPETPDKLFVVLFGDARYLAWTGHIGYLDLRSGEVVTKPPRELIESVAYNIGTLTREHLRQAAHGGHGNEQTGDAAGLDG